MKYSPFPLTVLACAVAAFQTPATFSASSESDENLKPSAELGHRANQPSENPSVSADGRYVAFQSAATNLDPRDENDRLDIFVRDTVAGTTELISMTPDGAPGNDYSVHPTISDDGRYVAFHSQATDLVPDDNNNAIDVFVHDREKSVTALASVSSDGVQGNNISIEPQISGNGQFVAFVSAANNLISGDANGNRDIFVRDLKENSTEAVSKNAEGALGTHKSVKPSISSDGRFVTFESPSENLVPIDDNKSNEHEWNYPDIFVHDRKTGKTEIVTLNIEGQPANNMSVNSAISGDGRHVAFQSRSNDLTKGYPQDNYSELYTRGRPATRTDIYVHDRKTGKTSLVSAAPGGEPGDRFSFEPAITGDGKKVIFSSGAQNLMKARTSDVNVFVRNIKERGTDVASAFEEQKLAGTNCLHAAVSKDGSTVVFQCNYGRADKFRSDIYVRKLGSKETQIASVSSGASPTEDYWVTLPGGN